MTTIPPRAVLEKMKRAEIQKICKEHGLKANLRTTALVDLLVNINVPRPRVAAPSRTSSRSSSRTRARTGSIVIDESDQEVPPAKAELIISSSRVPEPIVFAPKSRKAREIHPEPGRLRPLATEGGGRKTATRPGSRSKRTSRSTQQVQPTIIEEPEIIESAESVIVHVNDPPNTERPIVSQPPDERSRQETLLQEEIDKRIAETMRPLHDQIKQMMTQLGQMQTLRAEAERLQARINTVDSLEHRIHDLALEVEGLRAQNSETAGLSAEVSRLKNTVKQLESRPALPSTPQFSSTPYNIRHKSPHEIVTSTADSDFASVPGALGKRPREPSEAFPASEVGEQESETQGPQRKKTKLTPKDALPTTPANQITVPGQIDEAGEDIPQIPVPRALARFRVYTDIDAGESKGSQSNTHLPTVNVPSSPTQPRAARDLSLEPFNFTFMPPPTPVLPPAAYNIPNPETPTSPTPASGDGDTSLLRRNRAGSSMRMGIFGPLGPTPGTRSSRPRPTSSTGGIYVNPAALRRAPSIGGAQSRPMTGSEAAATFGLRQVGSVADGSEDALRSTIYGTELERDHRFGDFGVEGVASGFWTGGRR